MLSLVNVQISTTAKYIAKRDLNYTSVSSDAEGDIQHPHENGEGTTELHTCSGCVTDTSIEGSLRKYQLRKGLEETTIGKDHRAKLDVNLLLSRIKMLIPNLTELVAGISPVTPTPRNDFGRRIYLSCAGHHCGNCEPECLSQFA
jgi:hypothetical protein